MEQKKKIPLRQCVGCCERKPKGELIRVVRTPEGDIVLDNTGRKNGRGCYVCPNVKCFNKARKSGKLASHLECAIPEEVYASLEERIAEGE
jgi:predicted RNA-binding protein YlxR (DUF448 family)